METKKQREKSPNNSLVVSSESEDEMEDGRQNCETQPSENDDNDTTLVNNIDTAEQLEKDTTENQERNTPVHGEDDSRI